MNYLLFVVYLALFCWLLTKVRFIQATSLGSRTIIVLFLLKVLAGMAYGWISLYHYAIADSLAFQAEGVAEYHLLLSDPKEYLSNLFTNTGSDSFTALFDTTDSFWNNLRSNIIIKILSIFNIFSNRNYFINILFYNFLVFFGPVCLYRIFIQVFPARKNTLLVTVFLLPSFLYFTSGIHRDGLIFLALGIVCFNMFCIVKNEGLVVRRVMFIFLGLLLIFLLRNFVFIVLVPALIAWGIAEKAKKFVLLSYIVVYTVFTVLFFSLKFIHPALNLPGYVSSKQMAFIQIGQGVASTMNVHPLFPGFKSFFHNAPQALNHTLMRPYLPEILNSLYIPSAIEIFIYEILFVAFLLSPLKVGSNGSFIYFGIFFSLSMFLLIGYTIPILGAIVRYRSIYFPLLITSIACLIDTNKLKTKFYYK